MLRLADGVFTWSSLNPEKQYNFNGFLLATPEGNLVVDPPSLSDEDKAYVGKIGFSADVVVITNRNHLRNRDWWLARKKVPTAMHRDEAGEVDIEIERFLGDGDEILGGVTAVHLPGKSPGEIGLYWERRRLLLLGDALIAPFGKLSLIPEAKLDDPRRLRQSLKRLERLDFETLLLADGDPILWGAKPAVALFLRSLG